MIERDWGRRINDLFREVRNRHYGHQDNFDLAQLAILNVIQALQGKLTEEEVLEALGDEETPNAVSIATRYRLPHLSAA